MSASPVKPPCNLPLLLSVIQMATDFVSIADAVNGIFRSCKQLSRFGRREWLPQNIDDDTSSVLLEQFSNRGRLNNVRTIHFDSRSAVAKQVTKYSLQVTSKHSPEKLFRCSTLMIEVLGDDPQPHITSDVKFKSLKKCTLWEEAVKLVASATQESIKSMLPVLEDVQLYSRGKEETANAVVALVKASDCGLKRIVNNSILYRPKLIALVHALEHTPSAATLSCIEGFELEDTQQKNDALMTSMRNILQPDGRLLSSLQLEQSMASRDSTDDSLQAYLAYAAFILNVRTSFLGDEEQAPLPADVFVSGKLQSALGDATTEMHVAAAKIEAVKRGINPQSTTCLCGIDREAIRYSSRGFRCWCFPEVTQLDLELHWKDEEEEEDEDDTDQHIVLREAMAAGNVYPNVETISLNYHAASRDHSFHVSELSCVGLHLPKLRQVNVNVESEYEEHFVFPSFMSHMTTLDFRPSHLPPLSYRIELSCEEDQDDIHEQLCNIELGCRHHVSSLLSTFPRIEIVDSRDILPDYIFEELEEPRSPRNLPYLSCFTSLVSMQSSLLPDEVIISYERHDPRGEDEDEDEDDNDNDALQRITVLENLVARSPGWTFTSNGRFPSNDEYIGTLSYRRPTQKHSRGAEEDQDTVTRNVRQRVL